MMIRRSLLLVAFSIALASCSTHSQTCADHFAGGAQPVIENRSMNNKTKLLCFEGYAVTHSGISRTPIWSAEHLSTERIAAARELKRKNAFHAEELLPPSDRAELADYVRSGFDRGHMAPSGDMPTATAQYESFSLANMVPQNPNNNQNLWEGIESAVRSLAERYGEVYVVTGPLFEGESLERLNGRVLVPTSIYKAIYVPSLHQAGAYVTPNAKGMEYQTLSIADLEKRIGINVFPKLPEQIKSAPMDLPVPKPHRPRKS